MASDAHRDPYFDSDVLPSAVSSSRFHSSQISTVATENMHQPATEHQSPVTVNQTRQLVNKSSRSKPGVNQRLVCSFKGCKNTKEFPRRAEFDKHLREHERPIACPVMGFLKQSSRADNLKRHMKNVHGVCLENCMDVTHFVT
ncbi:hypothetical protein B0T14DRAFT_522650 [Immersiella caudata]|uniref:C2H2-type domain-containing protein n=1 Tax=Immersiella caudata TaxID=314043 RepID=A0AA39WIT6_9PEZI|nr:hypothetical protein B0T14DRAFT_522650 [Immersiella caudata]